MSSKRRHHHTLAMGLLASLMAPAAAWAQSGAEQTLLDQGQYWQERGDTERAGEAWQKLLRINPQNAQALYGMALVELNAQRPEGAQRYLTQLQAAHPRSPLVSRLQESIRTGRNAPQIETARQQARSGQASQALSTYQAALGDRAPTGPLALEYYQTLGATAGGWDEARRGLSRMAQESPEDPQIALALAQHLTYRESTRRDGIAQLARLAGRPDVGKAATEGWRKALAWTGNRSADIPLYQEFLRAYPGDTAVQTRLVQAQNLQKQAQNPSRPAAGADPLRLRTTAGFQALDDGELDAAEAAFLNVLEARPSDGDALGGLGILRLRQERFADARGLLERASRAGSASRWKQALDSATYWSLVEQATSERERGDAAAARRTLEQAVRLNPAEVTAETDLADLLVEAGQYDAAEAAYRRVLARQADNPDAVRGLVGVLAQNNKAAEALALVEKLSPSQQEKVGALGRLRAAQALGQARAATERGDTAAARVALEDALLNDPASPWVRLDLARLYLRMGAVAEARGVMDGLLLSNPHMPEALYASALLASEASDWPSALALLDRIPEKHRTRDIAALQKRVWVHVQAQAAAALAVEGRRSEALATLVQAESFATQDAELLGALALAYADAGEPQRALGMVRQVLARTARPDVGLRLQYAATLLKTQQDVELAGILRQLQTAPMSERERRSFADIRRAYIVRQADGLREAGDLVAAYDTLAPLLAEQAEEPQAMAALARMYAANNDYAPAQALYARLLEKSPNDLSLLLQTAAMATGAKDYGYAESLLSVALARAPRDPEVLTAAGRLYRVQGKNTKATEFFTAAVAAENAQRDAVLAASGVAAGPARSGNPFAQRAVSLQRTGGGLAVPGAATAPVARSPVGYTPMQYAPQPVARSHTPTGLYIPDPAGASRFAPAPQALLQAPPMTPASYYPEVSSPAAAPSSMPAGTARSAPPAGRATTPSLPRQAPASAGAPVAAAPAPAATYPPAALPTPPAAAAAGYITPAQAYAGYGGGLQVVPPVQRLPVAPQPSAWATAGTLGTVPDPSRPRTVRDELREAQQSQISTFSVGATARARQGEAGMSQLSEIEAPVQLKMSVGDGHLILGVTPTGASAGSPGTPYGTLSRFGGGPVTALDMPLRAPGSQSDSGIGVSVGYESGGLKADIGSTPLGFGQADVTGGVRYRMPINDELTMAVDLSRRPVSDSLLSFAGARDARTGDRWGGVSATGGRVDLTWDDGELGLYGYGSLHGLTGTRVRSNARAELGGGMYWHVHRNANADLTAGLSFSGLSYQRNLRYFTVGHGGYFSPQQFVSFGIPVEWAQRNGRLSYQLKGSVGVQYFKEDAAPYFPNSPSRQASAVLAASDALAFGETGATAMYPGQSRTGLGYNLGAAMEYQMHPQVFVGGHLALNNARNYREFAGGLYVRYAFQPYNGLQAFPVNPLRSPYGN